MVKPLPTPYSVSTVSVPPKVSSFRAIQSPSPVPRPGSFVV
jgi:hypothetical protein